MHRKIILAWMLLLATAASADLKNEVDHELARTPLRGV